MNNDSPKPINCAHRGASGHAPENTLAALKLAISMGAPMSELDVQQTADNRLVLFHDDSLDRTSNGEGPLWKKSLADLTGLDAGSWYDRRFTGEPIPTLEQVFEIARDTLRLNIEVKLHGHESDVAQLVVNTIRQNGFSEQCMVTSFGFEVADAIKALAPELTVGYIFDASGFTEAVFDANIDVLSTHYEMVDEAFMKKARASGKQVHVWTVNTRTGMRKMWQLGVDAIITNYPDRLAQVLGN